MFQFLYSNLVKIPTAGHFDRQKMHQQGDLVISCQSLHLHGLKKKKVKENEETGKVEDKRRSDRHKKQSTADGE